MEMKDIVKLLIKVSNKLRDHKCAFERMNSEDCRDCTLASEVDYIIWQLKRT